MNRCAICGRKLKNSETTCGVEFCKVCEGYEKQLAEKDNLIKEINQAYIETYKREREKDKEIEELKAFMNKWHFKDFEDFEKHYNYLMTLKNREQLANENEALKDTIAVVLAQKKNVEKNIRKQVCDAIKEKLKKQIIPTAGSWLSYYDITETNDLLDQIEGAEQL